MVELEGVPPTRRRAGRGWRSWRLVVALLVLAVIAGLGVYAGTGYLAYQDLSIVKAHCGDRPPAVANQTPADFAIEDSGIATPPDPSPYFFADASEVSFSTRGGDLTLRAWYAPPRRDGGPIVILVHGYNACRRDWTVLLPAGMLHRAGFGVLIPDLRNHGDSDSDGGRWAGGAKEFRDVLGAWDWLRGRGVVAARIGIYGVSLGAATTTIAFGEEPQVAAAWADSSYASFAIASSQYAQSKGYPGWVGGSAIPIGRLLGDPELGARDPGDEVLKLAGRPFFIVHGLADTTIQPHNAIDLATAALKGGTYVEPWLVPGSGHVREMLLVTDRYESRLDAFFSGAIGQP